MRPGATLTPSTVYSYSANYDHAGNVTSYTDQEMGSWTFAYDHLNRLMSGTPTAGVYSGQGQELCMDYDSFGNRTQADLQTTACKPNPTPAVFSAAYDPNTASYNAANQVGFTTVNSAVNGFAYDAAGEVTYDGANYYAYDAEGRVCATQTAPYSGGVVAYGYLYDAEGRRVAKGSIAPAPLGQWPSCNPATNGFTLTESYVLGQGGERLTTTAWTGGAAGTGTWQGTNVYAGGKLIAAYDAATSGAAADAGSAGGLHFQLTDPLGTRRVQTNSAGEAELDCQSLPFGDQLSCFPDPNAPGGDQDEDATGMLTGIHFTGKERDAESGLDYFGARYYASNMGRFISPDPSMEGAILELPQTWNKYSYEYNRPLYGTDPDGRCPPCIGALIGGVVEGGFDLGKQLYKNGGHLSDVSWGEVGANATGGAVSGAIAVATGGASLVESAVVGDLAAGVTSNVVGGAVSRALDPGTSSDDVLSASDVSEDALAGFVGGAGGHIAADMVHIPEEPRPVKTRSGSVYRRQMAKNQAATNSRNRAIANQFVRSGITGSFSTHLTNGIWDWLMFTPPPPPPEPKATVTSSECDSLPDGSTRCQ